MRILVFAAHPDDEVIGVGGTLIKRKLAGDETAVCYFTRAVKERNTDKQIRNKIFETKKAGKVLSLDKQYFLNYPSGCTDSISHEKIIESIKKVIKEFQPNIIYTHYMYDLHSDHRILTENVLIAVRPVNFEFITHLYFYNEATSSTFWSLPEHVFKPNVFVDISNVIEEKLKAFSCYKSQKRANPSVRTVDFLRNIAGYHGQMIGVKYAEVFELIYHCETRRI